MIYKTCTKFIIKRYIISQQCTYCFDFTFSAYIFLDLRRHLNYVWWKKYGWNLMHSVVIDFCESAFKRFANVKHDQTKSIIIMFYTILIFKIVML